MRDGTGRQDSENNLPGPVSERETLELSRSVGTQRWQNEWPIVFVQTLVTVAHV